jgi:hypothetical protein
VGGAGYIGSQTAKRVAHEMTMFDPGFVEDLDHVVRHHGDRIIRRQRRRVVAGAALVVGDDAKFLGECLDLRAPEMA